MIEGLDGESGSSSRVWVARRHRSGRLQEVETWWIEQTWGSARLREAEPKRIGPNWM